MDDTAGILDPVPAGLSAGAGLMGPVYISRALSDRLEVPEEWQAHDSFDARLAVVLLAAVKAVGSSSGGRITFPVVIPDNATWAPAVLPLALDLDHLGNFVLDYESHGH